jgi:hypothetical protein
MTPPAVDVAPSTRRCIPFVSIHKIENTLNLKSMTTSRLIKALQDVISGKGREMNPLSQDHRVLLYHFSDKIKKSNPEISLSNLRKLVEKYLPSHTLNEIYSPTVEKFGSSEKCRNYVFVTVENILKKQFDA